MSLNKFLDLEVTRIICTKNEEFEESEANFIIRNTED